MGIGLVLEVSVEFLSTVIFYFTCIIWSILIVLTMGMILGDSDNGLL